MAVNFSNEMVLQDHNNKDLIKVLPSIIFLVLIMLVGFFGNALVLYIYLVKLKPTTIRCFIIRLAAIDLSICLFDIPVVIIDLRHQYTFGRYVMLCKMVHTFHDILFITAAFLLLAVAAERYRKVCQPFKKQMTIIIGKITCVVSCTIAAILSLPAFFIYGSSTVQLETSSINGTRCSIADDRSPAVLYLSYILWITVDFSAIFILITLYGLMWYRVLRHVRSRTRGENQPARMESATRWYSEESLENTSPRDIGVSRMTKAMFWITLITILAYLPVMCKMIIELYSRKALEDFMESLSYFYDMFTRSYYIQCASNPLLYGWFNTRFQYELKQIFKLS